MKEETVDILEYNRIALEEELNMFMELLGDNWKTSDYVQGNISNQAHEQWADGDNL